MGYRSAVSAGPTSLQAGDDAQLPRPPQRLAGPSPLMPSLTMVSVCVWRVDQGMEGRERARGAAASRKCTCPTKESKLDVSMRALQATLDTSPGAQLDAEGLAGTQTASRPPPLVCSLAPPTWRFHTVRHSLLIVNRLLTGSAA